MSADDLTPEARALAEMREESWGRVMPDAALKNALAWEDRDKERQRQEIEVVRQRELELATPVRIFLDDGAILDLPRLLYEEIEDLAVSAWERVGYDFDEVIQEVLEPLLREGLIMLAQDVPKPRVPVLPKEYL